MLFSSPLFLFAFLPLTLGVCFLLAPRRRNFFLLMASLFFYAWGEPAFVFLMILSLVINYGIGRGMEGKEASSRRTLLTSGLVFNLGLLFVFKYLVFSVDALNGGILSFFSLRLPVPGIALPIGISFFTFQSVSYLMDVFRRETPPQRNFIDAALYIALFPQLIAGPIVRYRDVARQLARRSPSPALMAAGIQRFVIGLSKKVVLADSLGEVSDFAFGLAGGALGPGVAWIGLFSYSFQIYFDFSGYSDMAIGLGRMLGFEFLENFNYPYVSQSIREFWRRWHISLSTWFRDYLYIPLGGNRGPRWRTHANLWVVFLLCGLWHGASWNFLFWGALHGSYLVLERMGGDRLLAFLWSPFRRVIVIFLVMIAWVFFRAESLPAAVHYLGALFGITISGGVHESAWALLDAKTILLLLSGVLASLPLFPFFRQRTRRRLRAGTPVPEGVFLSLRLAGLTALFWLCATFIAGGTYAPFLYFRF